jgi:hypothetical protein
LCGDRLDHTPEVERPYLLGVYWGINHSVSGIGAKQDPAALTGRRTEEPATLGAVVPGWKSLELVNQRMFVESRAELEEMSLASANG